MATTGWGALRKRAEDASRPPEPGWYTLEVKNAEVKYAQSSGNPMISTRFVVTDGGAVGKTVTNNFNLTSDNDFALAMFFKSMEALGFDDAFFESLPEGDAGLEVLASSMPGRQVRAKLGTRDWQGRTFPNIEELQKAGGIGGAAGGSGGVVGLPATPAVPSVGGAVPALPATPTLPATPAVPNAGKGAPEPTF